MEEVFSYIVGIGLAIAAAVYALGYVLAAIYWCIVNLGYLLVCLLDWLLSASLLPQAPEAMWAAWGALAGAVIGFWTIAPVYGWRGRNALLIVLPLGILAAALLRYVLQGA